MSSARYTVIGLLVGPYLPNKNIMLGSVTLSPVSRKYWKTLDNPVSVQTSHDRDSLVTFIPNVTAISAITELSFECDAISSKEADILGRQAFERLCDALNVSCIENKYYSQVTDVKRLSPGADPESRFSDPILVVNYESHDFNALLEKYTRSILALSDPEATKIVTAFGKALRDNNTFEQYKILEMIADALSTEVKAQADITSTAAEEAKVIAELLTVLQSDGSDSKKKKAIKKSSEELRRLNLEQNGKRIAATAEYLGLKGGAAKIIDDAIRYRNKVMAHYDKPVGSDPVKGPKDVQESARFFVIYYLDKQFGLKLPQLTNVPFKNDWYRIAYVNSTAGK